MKTNLDWHKLSVCIWLVNLVVIVFAHWFYQVVYLCFPVGFLVLLSLGFVFVKHHEQKGSFMDHFRGVPVKYFILLIFSILYTLINFFLCMYLLREGSGHIHNGVYCLWNHGFVRRITQAEYEALRIAEARLLSGHMITFSALLVFFSCKQSK